jgi:hypothetical protein
LADQHGRPGGVVGFHADEGDVDRLLFGELLGVGDVECAHRDGEFRLLHRMRDAQAVLAHVLDMGRPRIDEGHVLAGLNHVCAGIAADRAGTNDRNFSAHSVLPYRQLALSLAANKRARRR